MERWAAEEGTLWALETGGALPPMCEARVSVEFKEMGLEGADALARAMNLSTPDPVRERLASGRRCFVLTAGDEIATYGWVTHGAENVGELERDFALLDDEAYIWDCSTLPDWRGQRCFSALLSHIIYQLHADGTRRIWIGASRHNESSIRAFANAGFSRVVDVSYRRFFRLTLMWIHRALSAPQALITAAHRVLLNEHERLVGQLAIGYKR